MKLVLLVCCKAIMSPFMNLTYVQLKQLLHTGVGILLTERRSISARSPHHRFRLPCSVAVDQLEECATALNYEGFTTNKIMTLTHNNTHKNKGRRNNMGTDASMEKRPSPEELNE